MTAVKKLSVEIHVYLTKDMQLPVKMLVNANSTFVESRADVSINAKLFLSTKSSVTQSCPI